LSLKHKILVTGSAGFIGFHLANLLISQGHDVIGVDGFTDYYDVSLKKRRHALLLQNPNFREEIVRLEDKEKLSRVFGSFKPSIVVHLAAQAGVRYSLEYPQSYIDSNVQGSFNIIELAKEFKIEHLLMASTSSIYGGNEVMPFSELHTADAQLTIYAATKKAMESIAHSYAHLWHLPTTVFRFFTVYGPWGRPDLALFKFVSAILEDRPIDVYNHGKMKRDFTYVADLVKAISLLIDIPPGSPGATVDKIPGDSISSVAPYRVVNIGNSDMVELNQFIKAIENALGKKAIKNMMGMQKGDVEATWADCSLLEKLTGYTPNTDYRDGISAFVNWYRAFYNC
jgi:UDP-glucuronate 4-epimerase